MGRERTVRPWLYILLPRERREASVVFILSAHENFSNLREGKNEIAFRRSIFRYCALYLHAVDVKLMDFLTFI